MTEKSLLGNIKSILSESTYTQLALRFLLVMFVLSISRLLFYLFNKDMFSTLDYDGLLVIMKGGVVFDLTACIYANLLVIVLSLLPFKFKYTKKYQTVLARIFIFFNTLCLLMNFSDIVYYRFTLKRTTSTIFKEFSHNNNLFKIFTSSLFDFWYVTLAGIITIGLFIFLANRISKPKVNTKSNIAFYTIQIIMMPLIAGLCVAGMRGGFTHSTRPITLSNAAKYINNSNERAIVLNTPFALIRTINKKPLSKKNYIKPNVLEQNYRAIHISANDTISEGYKGSNVVVIILESFARAHIGYFNTDIKDYKSHTPFLDSLCNNAFVFKNAFANGCKSIDALPSVIASIPSINEPFILSTYSGNKINSIASELNKENYYTAFFHGAANGSMGFDAFTKQASYKDYFGRTEFKDDSQFDGIWGIWDEPFFQFFANTMGEFKQPFMSTIFSLSSHHPFKVPAKYKDVFLEGEFPILKCISYTDNALRQFFNNCKKQDWYDNTIFVITADHSSQTNIKKYNTPYGGFAIPLIFFSPKGKLSKGQVSNKVVDQIDIMPSLLKLLEVKNDYIAFGEDVFSQEEGFAFNYVSGVYQIFMDDYLLQFDGKRSIALYDIKKDIYQENNVLDKHPEVKEKLEFKLKCIFQEYSNRLIDNNLSIN